MKRVLFRGLIATLALIAVVALGYWVTREKPNQRNLSYATMSSRNVLDIYIPDGASSALPVVVWIHGGGFRQGSKAWTSDMAPLLEAGFAVVAVNYRYSTEAIWPAQLDDISAAIAFLRENADQFGLNPGRVALFGASAGGHLAATTGIALAADPATSVTAVVDWFGPVDFAKMDIDMAESGLKPTMGPTVDPDSPESVLIGAPVGGNPDLVWSASPINYVEQLPQTASLPAFLIMHGAKDTFIAAGQSERLADALRSHPVPTEVNLQILAEGTHGDGDFKDEAAMETVVSFLKATLLAE
ncbi:MAG: alpha/beta hydrolase [Pseudomonadota bacterium]